MSSREFQATRKQHTDGLLGTTVYEGLDRMSVDLYRNTDNVERSVFIHDI